MGRVYPHRASPRVPNGSTDMAQWALPSRKTLNRTTSVLTAAILAYAIGAGITAAAGTRLALQLILSAGFEYRPLQSPHIER